MARHGVATVCDSARCPNRGVCWGESTATFMVLGDVCTRNCRFCHVPSAAEGVPPDPTEPARVRAAAQELNLDYVVVTSVDRDDLPDGGAGHIAACIKKLRESGFTVEALIPDFSGNAQSLEAVSAAGAQVLAHNLETVEALSPAVRDRRASYHTSLAVLSSLKRQSPSVTIKSSVMVGLGETTPQLLSTFDDLAAADVDILVVGQYLQPSRSQLPVDRFYSPQEFERLAEEARSRGFAAVVAEPMARTSLHARACYHTTNGQ